MPYDAYAYPIIGEYDFNKQRDRYLIVTGQKKYSPTPLQYTPPQEDKSASIETILEQDSRALLDKVVTTAFSIVYRIQIYNDIQKKLDYNRLKTSSNLTQLYDWIPGTNMNVERRKSMLIKELHNFDRQKLEEKAACWKDLSQPINDFVQLFHKNEELKQDRKLLQ